MTDKQIIDVTKCIHFDKSDIPNGCNCYWDGECNHYCYYKKYAYEHQECKELKKCLLQVQNASISLNKQIDQLKAEIEQEKALKETYLACYKAKHEDIEGTLFKLKQTLTEIKEIAKENIRIADLEGLNGVYRRGLAKQILQKISEVTNE